MWTFSYLFSLFFLILIPSVSSSAKDSGSCQAIMDSGPVETKWRGQDVYDVVYKSGQFSTLYAHREVLPGEEYVTETLRFSREDGLPSSWPKSVLASISKHPTSKKQILKRHPELLPAKRKVDQLAMGAVVSSNGKFESRRGWGRIETNAKGKKVNSFSEKNLKVARKHLLDSSYVIVRDSKTHKILGSIRNIEVADGQGRKLPEEKFLKINLPRLGLVANRPQEAFWQNEIGTYFVDEDLDMPTHNKVILELWNQMFRSLFSHRKAMDNIHRQAFHTYGDKASLHLYWPIGFRKLRVYKYKGVWVDYSHLKEEDVPPIIIGEGPDTKKWWPMVLLPQEAVKFNERFSKRGLPGVDAGWLVERRRELSDRLVGADQMGALFPHLLQDLGSGDPELSANALGAILELLESYSEHQEMILKFAQRNEPDGLEEMIRIKKEALKKLDALTAEVSRQIKSPTNYDLMLLADLTGFFLGMEKKRRDYLGVGKIINRCFIPLLVKGEPQSLVLLLAYSAGSMSALDWLSEMGQVWDMSRPEEVTNQLGIDESEWANSHDVLKEVKTAENSSREALMATGMTSEEVDVSAEKLRKALFVVPKTPAVKPGGVYYGTSPREAEVASLLLSRMKNRSISTAKSLIALAASKQYQLEN